MLQGYITKFNTSGDYETFIESSAFTYPNVSYVEADDSVKFNPVEYQWVASGTTCDGYDKYEKEIEQWRHKGTSEWHNVIPETSRKGQLIEADSEDCGYTPEP